MPNAQFPTRDPARRSYVLKRRVGQRTVSTHVGAKDGAADIAFIDAIFRYEALRNRRIANTLVLDLKLMHTENEQNFNVTEAMVTTALTAAGYHRHNRGPWRKARTSGKEPNGAPRIVPTPGFPRAPRSGSSSKGDLRPTSSALLARVETCRRHYYELEDLYQSTPIRARSKTATRIYARYSKRAINRLAAAEKSLATVQSIAQKEANQS
jgi:hypothetical protein